MPPLVATLTAARRAAERLLEVDPVAAEQIVDAVADALARRSATVSPLARDERAAIEREGACVALFRASSSRRRHDFVGAALLLAEGFPYLAAAERARLSLERALVAAELAGPWELDLPASLGERERVRARLEPAARHIDAALAGGGGSGLAHLLAGAIARCRGDDHAAVHHLDRAVSRLPPEDLPPERWATVRLHRELAALTGAGRTDGAVAAIVAALDDGARASPELLDHACDRLTALDVEAAELRRRAAHLALTPAPPPREP